MSGGAGGSGTIYKWKRYKLNSKTIYTWDKWSLDSQTIYKWNKWDIVNTTMYKWYRYRFDTDAASSKIEYSSTNMFAITLDDFQSATYVTEPSFNTAKCTWQFSGRVSYTFDESYITGVVGKYVNLNGKGWSDQLGSILNSYMYSNSIFKVTGISKFGGTTYGCYGTEYRASGAFIDMVEVNDSNMSAHIPNPSQFLDESALLQNSDGYMYNYRGTYTEQSKGSTSYGQVTSTSSSAYPSNGVSGSYWYESAGSEVQYSKGSTSYGKVESESASTYPNDSYSGGYWYDNKSTRTEYSQGAASGTVYNTNRAAYPDNGKSGSYWYVFDGEA